MDILIRIFSFGSSFAEIAEILRLVGRNAIIVIGHGCGILRVYVKYNNKYQCICD
jgi:hypothetical protein